MSAKTSGHGVFALNCCAELCCDADSSWCARLFVDQLKTEWLIAMAGGIQSLEDLAVPDYVKDSSASASTDETRGNMLSNGIDSMLHWEKLRQVCCKAGCKVRMAIAFEKMRTDPTTLKNSSLSCSGARIKLPMANYGQIKIHDLRLFRGQCSQTSLA
ncbi:hypothetical protein ACO0K9_03270 [Undibacterium sp. Ji50W]|uniref:hypothetical protein n=1 Tax=Undibacterium sp. Ji50W TaxID=3413041 RepID=UPI003BF3383D